MYKVSHLNHPSAVWARSNIDHYRWLYDLFYQLIGEYKYRYEDKRHKCEDLLLPLLASPVNIPIVDWQDPPQAMPDDCKRDCPVEGYRHYYLTHKVSDESKWTDRRSDLPSWLFSHALFPIKSLEVKG